MISLLANEYVQRGIPTAILSFAGNQQAYKLDDRVETVSAGAASGGNPLVRLKRIAFMRKYFKENKNCNIFSFSTIGTGFIVISTLFMKRKMLVSERTDPKSCDHKLYRDFFYTFADALVCQTKDSVECFPKILQKKACVIGNPVDPTIPQVYCGERKHKIVTAGRLEPVKNHAMLIEAFGEFVKEFPDYTLDIYGKGSLEENMQIQIAEKELEGKVILHGFSANVKEEIYDSSMFVLSSNYEGISNSMIEALAMGIPVIATDCPIGGSRTYIENEVNGLLVPTGDDQAMTAAMKKIAADSELSEKMSKKASEIREMSSVEKIADQMLVAAGMR